MNVLAFDTASPTPSVALLSAGILFEERLPQERGASEELLPAIERCLRGAGLPLARVDCFAVCSGPGSFTGLRVGIATAWALARSAGAPLEAVSTLEAMAEAFRGDPPANSRQVTSALAAGRGEIVVATFRLDDPRAILEGSPRRLSVEDVHALALRETVVALPVDLVPGSAAFAGSPASALAAAVARAPRGIEGTPPRALYSRPSAAEEKRGAS